MYLSLLSFVLPLWKGYWEATWMPTLAEIAVENAWIRRTIAELGGDTLEALAASAAGIRQRGPWLLIQATQ